MVCSVVDYIKSLLLCRILFRFFVNYWWGKFQIIKRAVFKEKNFYLTKKKIYIWIKKVI